MNKLILICILALLTLGCAGRKVKKSKELYEAKKTAQRDVTIDKTSNVKTETDEAVNVSRSSENITTSWRYVAPTMPTLNPKPIWLRIGNDSINLSALPEGSSIESLSGVFKSKTDSGSIIKRLTEELNNLKKSDKSTSSEFVQASIVRKEIVKESITWYLIGAALLVGLFLPKIITLIWKFIKSKIYPL